MDQPTRTDMYLRCQDCTVQFLWAINEQRFYQERGFAVPKRCKDCRVLKRQTRHGDAARREGFRHGPSLDKARHAR